MMQKTRSMKSGLMAWLVLVGSAAALAQPGADSPAVRALAKALDSLATAYHVPGLSVAVLHDDSLLYSAGFGSADLEQGTPATPQTNYRIASLTKPISATILLGLEEEGELSTEAPIKPMVPGYEDFYRNVSTYILANLPELSGLVENFDYMRDDILVRHHLTHTAEFVPGDTFKYNGFVFGTLARLMEVTLDAPYHDVVQQQILEPLGMAHSAASQETAPDSLLALLARPYTYDEEADEYVLVPYPEQNVNAGAGIVSNVLDLARFDAAINANQLLSAETQVRAWTRQRTNSGEETPYGLGWFVQERGGEPVVWHYGWQPGAYSGLYLKLPARGLTLFLLANGENLSAPFHEAGYDQDVFASPYAEAFWEVFVGE